MSKGIVRTALRAATERLRKEREKALVGHLIDRRPATVTDYDELLAQCDEALRAGTVWTTAEVLAAVERVLGPISKAEANAIITALRTGHLTPVPPTDPEPTSPAA